MQDLGSADLSEADLADIGGVRKFRRNYKACEACRRKKTRCDLGGSDQSLFAFCGPPCAQCRRERRECIFRQVRTSRKRRKRDNLVSSTSPKPSNPDTNHSWSEFQQGRISLEAKNDVGAELSNLDNNTVEELHEPPRDHVQQVVTWTPQPILQARTKSLQPEPTDTLENASQRSDDQKRLTDQVTDRVIHTVVLKGNDPLNILLEAVPGPENDPPESPRCSAQIASRQSGPRTAITLQSPQNSSIALKHAFHSPYANNFELSNADKEVLASWKASKFVRAGLLSAEWALTYVDLFFRNLSHLSPVLTDYYAHHARHQELISNEPLLCSTILMISSRYHTLPGIASDSRCRFIHNELWTTIQKAIQQITFGQSTGSCRQLRSLGSIEALLLMMDWYPQVIHLSPRWHESESELLTPKELPQSPPDVWHQDIVRPIKAFDQRSWMLLGTAHMLGHELGIFGRLREKDSLGEAGAGPLRRKRTCELLFIYTTLLAARMGYHSMISLTFSSLFLEEIIKPSTKAVEAWIKLIKLTKDIHSQMFSNPLSTQTLMESGDYIKLLEHFQPLLQRWHQDYLAQCTSRTPQTATSTNLQDLLYIEYHCVRMYTNSPALQAAALRTSTHASHNPSGLHSARKSAPPLVEQREHSFVKEVIEDAYCIIELGIELARASSLRFHPVRTFHRLIAGCVFMIKANVLGVQHDTMRNGTARRDSLTLLDDLVQALKSSAVDDVHPSAYYALVLEHQLSILKPKLSARQARTVPPSPALPGTTTQDHIEKFDWDWQLRPLDPFNDTYLFPDFNAISDFDLGIAHEDYQ